jgi:hypothetical protein
MEKLKYQKVPIDTMNTQISLRLPTDLYTASRKYAKKHGFTSLQDFIKNTVRERLFGEDFSEEEKILIKKLIKACDEKGLWSTEEELFAKLEKKCK